MINITLSDEQVISLINQLPKKKKQELVEHLLFEEWIDSPEGQKLLKERERQFETGKTLSLKEMRKKLKASGKKI
jgi:ABC-type thiamine transport system substrate-binding protein